MSGEYSDDEIILEFINIFASLDIQEKTSLLARVLDSCAEVGEVKTILGDLEDMFTSIESVDRANGNNSAGLLDDKVRTKTEPKPKSCADLRQCLPADLQSLLISTNPQHDIKFTLSSRLNTQMSVSGYLLSKRRFYTTATGQRTASWKCVVRGCSYHALTTEGELKDNGVDTHNHQKTPELFDKKEARNKLIEKLVEGADASDLLEEAGEDILEVVGGMDAIKQAANRKKRKLVEKDNLNIKLETQEIKIHEQKLLSNESFDFNLLEDDDGSKASLVEMEMDMFTGESDSGISRIALGGKPNADSHHCLPEDLQSLIILANPHLDIKFTLSSRLNTQMSVAGYLLKKRRFYTTHTGLRSVSWKCVQAGCLYHALTTEGKLKHNKIESHNHERTPELFVKKEARLRLIQNLVEGAKSSAVIEEAGEEILGMVGGLEALMQAARRKKRKLKNGPDPLEIKLERSKLFIPRGVKSEQC